jgi:acetate kinase
LGLDRLTDVILAVNAGSTSVKLSQIEQGRRVQTFDTVHDALAAPTTPNAVVHRVVHGGDRPNAPAAIDDALLAELESLVDLAPLHQPPALALIDQCRTSWPDVPQFACFDTAFHATIPLAARTYALPSRLRDEVRVYGFHGLSHSWSSRRVAELAPAARRTIVAHLGGGQSLCSVLDGRSVGTTMGFTPLDGLVMATRCGAIDPGAVLWLQEHTNEDLAAVLDRESGLLGLCGSDDMQEVLRRREDGDPDATFAIEVTLHRFVALLGASVASLGGLDALVFTGGIGEHSRTFRDLVIGRMTWLGLAVTDRDVGEGREEITAPGAAVRTFVIEAAEDLEMARLLDEGGRLL